MQMLVIGSKSALRRAEELLRDSAVDGIDAVLMAESLGEGHGDLRRQLRAIEAHLVALALQSANNDRRAAAARLGIGLSSLYRKLEEFERLGLALRPAETGA